MVCPGYAPDVVQGIVIPCFGRFAKGQYASQMDGPGSDALFGTAAGAASRLRFRIGWKRLGRFAG